MKPLSASRLNDFLGCPHQAALWLDGFKPEGEVDATLVLIRDKGFEHEASVLAQLEKLHGFARGLCDWLLNQERPPSGNRSQSKFQVKVGWEADIDDVALGDELINARPRLSVPAVDKDFGTICVGIEEREFDIRHLAILPRMDISDTTRAENSNLHQK